MSLNKVLNRPMFRKEALRKGVLKTINANTGVMVGQPYTAPGVPAIRKPPTFLERMSVSGPARLAKGLGKGILGIPQLGGYYAGDKVGQALGIESDLGRMPFGLAGAYYASKAMPVLASAPALTSAAILAGPAYLGYAGKKEYDRIQKMSPKEKEAHYAKSQQFGMSYLDDEQFNDQFGKFVPKGPKEFDTKRSAAPKTGPGSGRVTGFKDRLTEEGNESKVVKGSVDINKVVANNLPENLGDSGSNMDSMSNKRAELNQENSPTDPDKVLAKVVDEEKTTDEQANKNAIDAGKQEQKLNKPTKIKASDGTQVDSEIITLAKQYRKELMAGQQSQAKLVFLSNLASGLISGKTSKGGLGGALEVFGGALGPAVNNYATIKLKENELSNEFMSSALDLASDEIKRRNEVIERPAIDGTPGMVQFTDKNGRVVNMTGIRLKDSTVMVAQPGQLDEYGRNKLQPLPPGSFNRFAPNSELDPKALETLMDLDQKYKAYQYGQKSVALIEKFKKEGKTGAGPVGRFNLFKGRLSEAMYDITGREMFSNEADAREKAAEYKDLLVNDWLKSNDVEGETDEDKRKNAGEAIDKLLGDTVNSKAIAKAIGEFTGEADQQALSQLAINETVMVYALANSLKAKDRLTANDIKMAKELVNIFPLLRGQTAVIRDLKSVNATILQDIQTLENTYTTALMGETATLKNYKKNYGLATSADFEGSSSEDLVNPFDELNTEQLLNLY